MRSGLPAGTFGAPRDELRRPRRPDRGGGVQSESARRRRPNRGRAAPFGRPRRENRGAERGRSNSRAGARTFDVGVVARAQDLLRRRRPPPRVRVRAAARRIRVGGGGGRDRARRSAATCHHARALRRQRCRARGGGGCNQELKHAVSSRWLNVSAECGSTQQTFVLRLKKTAMRGSGNCCLFLRIGACKLA